MRTLISIFVMTFMLVALTVQTCQSRPKVEQFTIKTPIRFDYQVRGLNGEIRRSRT